MSLAHAYIAIRDLYEDGGPVAPESWARSVQGSTGWTMLTTETGELLAAYYVGTIAGPPARGLFALFGNADAIESWDPDAMPAREMFRRRTSVASAAQRMRAWPVWIVDDDGETEVRRRLTPRTIGLPSVSAPWGTVTRLYRPALDVTLAGHALHVTLEDEPDRGA